MASGTPAARLPVSPRQERVGVHHLGQRGGGPYRRRSGPHKNPRLLCGFKAFFWISAGVPVAWLSAGLATVLAIAFALRRRDVLRFALVPWRLVLLVIGLFLYFLYSVRHSRLSAAAGDR